MKIIKMSTTTDLVIAFSFRESIIKTDVRSAPDTNSAMNDVRNDEHVTSEVAWSRDLRASAV